MKPWKLFVVCAFASLASRATADSPFDTPRPRPKPPERSGYTGLGHDSVSAEEVAKYTAPPLDPAVSRRIQTMLDVRGAGSGPVTSRGDRMFFTAKVTGQHQVWRQDGPMKFPIQLTGGEDRTTVVDIAPNDSFIVVARDVGGEENPGVYLQSPAGGALRLVQHTKKVQTSLQYITDDSKALYFRANDVAADSYAIYRHDIASGQREKVFDTPGIWLINDHRGDSQWLLAKLAGNTERDIFLYDVERKQLTPLLGQHDNEYYDVRFGAKPGQILVRTNKVSNFQRLYRIEGGKLEPITPEVPHDIASFAIDKQRRRIYYQLNEHGYARLFAIDARTFRPIQLPKLPAAENVRLTGMSHNGRFIQLTIDGSQLPPTSVTYDWQTRRLTTWRVPSTPEIDLKTFAKATLEHYPARDGTKIPMFVRRPAKCDPGESLKGGDGPCPVVVHFHGGPEGQSTAGFSAQGQLFVDAGFVFVEPNVRGSAGYGKAWLDADNGPKRAAIITDIEDCAVFIRASWSKDGQAPKIGVTGGSYGGYATLMAMTYFAGAYDAGVQKVGISNLVTFLQNTAPYRRILRSSEYGDPVKDRDALLQLSPITHAKKLKAPLLSIQGVNDPRVPVGEAIQIYKEAAARKIPGGLILFTDEGHGTTKRSNEVLAIGHTIAFFEKHLR